MELITAIRFLTIIPVPWRRPESPEAVGRSQAYFPLVGLGLGLALVGLDQGLGRVLADGPRAWLLVLALVVLSGGMHLDGLADSADGILGARGETPERRLAIMRDSRVGAYGVVALIAVLSLKSSAMASLLDGVRTEALLLAPCLGRAAVVVGTTAFPYARPAGLGLAMHQAARWSSLALAGAIALGASGVLLGWGGLVIAMIVTATTLAVAVWATRRLTGLTGDVYGALVEITEAVTLLLIAAGGGREWLHALLLG